jgi:N-acetylglucosamine malate deacetylase 2
VNRVLRLGRSRAEPAVPPFRSVLAVCAHPDDESFGLGAALHHFATEGAEVSVLCFTRGEASTLGLSTGELLETRSAELASAAAVLGAHRVELLAFPDGRLAEIPLMHLGDEVAEMAKAVSADLLLVFDEGGVTGHPDHCRATEAALVASPEVPVLAWCLPRLVAEQLDEELGTSFAGREDPEIDLHLRVDRDVQKRAITRHVSQSTDNPVLWRRLTLLGDLESFRWLRPLPACSQPRAQEAPKERSDALQPGLSPSGQKSPVVGSWE